MNRQLPSYSQHQTRSSNDSITQSAEYVLLERVLRRLLEEKPASQDETDLYLNYARHLAAAIVASHPSQQLEDRDGYSADSDVSHGQVSGEPDHAEEAANDVYLDDQYTSPTYSPSADIDALEQPVLEVVDEFYNTSQSSGEPEGLAEAPGSETPAASSAEPAEGESATQDSGIAHQTVVEAFFDSMGVNMAPGLVELESTDGHTDDDAPETDAILEATAAIDAAELTMALEQYKTSASDAVEGDASAVASESEATDMSSQADDLILAFVEDDEGIVDSGVKTDGPGESGKSADLDFEQGSVADVAGNQGQTSEAGEQGFADEIVDLDLSVLETLADSQQTTDLSIETSDQDDLREGVDHALEQGSAADADVNADLSMPETSADNQETADWPVETSDQVESGAGSDVAAEQASAVDDPRSEDSMNASEVDVHGEEETAQSATQVEVAVTTVEDQEAGDAAASETAMMATAPAPEATGDFPEGNEPPAESAQGEVVETVGTSHEGEATEPTTEREEVDESAAEVESHASEQAAASDELALTNQNVKRMEECLVEIKEALVDLAHRPSSPPVDLDPLVDAVQTGFDRSAEQSTQTSNAVASLSEHLSQFGQTIRGGVDKTQDVQTQDVQTQDVQTQDVQTQDVQTQDLAGTQVASATPEDEGTVEDRSARQAVVMVAVALIVIGWSILFWITTGSPRLALGTLIGASFIACCLLLSRRSRK